ncbi:magnesium protoporphyrin IX methyltransferase [Amorphus orientalis]|uniref:Magnesium protoporphyrin IX methyltransferase n=1 Tax=Amorphus orientalis TaxID=649198 RepID=A0AAE3VPL2_9HYPH|nr:magnesium protoporphyrin IX methyltransferase [Amorphus orientalis]MDQ0315460.1 magnesium-protoporphyrin O-methyltransferase [Amorphus orientalis]
MATDAYTTRRGELETYFDRTAADAWARLTSDAPVSRIRATVRAGRDRMRATLLSWLPDDLAGHRLLDAGCGTGALSLEAARRGADMVAVDLSPTLIALARDRTADTGAGRIDYRVGDMLDPAFGRFDHVVAMDSLIHYQAADVVRMLAAFAERADRSILVTFAPSTPLLATMHAVGRMMPSGNRAPKIVPIWETELRRRIERTSRLGGWEIGRTCRISSGFYTSQALELVRR